MPVLHKYTEKKGYYVLTSIKGNIITYQLTSEAQNKLIDAGIQPDQTFRRALLLDLIRTGDAYTLGTGPGIIDSDKDIQQLQFDFADDPEPESMIPCCHVCSSAIDLHLVEIKSVISEASILCPKCRTKKSGMIDTSIPLSLVSRVLLNRLLKEKSMEKVDDSVIAYQKLLNTEFKSKWETLKTSKPTQERLFSKDGGKQKTLL